MRLRSGPLAAFWIIPQPPGRLRRLKDRSFHDWFRANAVSRGTPGGCYPPSARRVFSFLRILKRKHLFEFGERWLTAVFTQLVGLRVFHLLPAFLPVHFDQQFTESICFRRVPPFEGSPNLVAALLPARGIGRINAGIPIRSALVNLRLHHE